MTEPVENANPEAPAPAKVDDSLISTEAPLDFTTKPEGFPDNFWDAEKNAPNVNQLYKEFQNRDKIAKDLRVKLSKGEFTGQAPQDPSEYVLELSDEMKPLVPDNDPLMAAAKLSAKEAGLPKDVFNKFMTPIIAELAKFKAEAEAPLTPEQQEAQKAQVEANKQAEIEKLGPSGNKIIAAIDEFRKGLLAEGAITEQGAETMRMMVFDAESARIMNMLRSRRGMPDNVPITPQIDAASSKADIESKMAKAFADRNEGEFAKYSAMLTKLS
jgi:hypothetical protein